jgi:hypothetical protein
MQRSKILSLDEILSTWLPLRMHAINNAAWAMDMQTRIIGSEEARLSIGDNLNYKSYVGNFLLPVYESGFVHGRALLEFVGLQAKNGKLIQIKRRRPSDIAIENYYVNGNPLAMVTPAEICAFINIPDPVVEWALVGIIENTNRLLSHVTSGEALAMAMHGQVRCAFEELPKVIKMFFYEKLGLSSDVDFTFVSWREVDTNGNCMTK